MQTSKTAAPSLSSFLSLLLAGEKRAECARACVYPPSCRPENKNEAFLNEPFELGNSIQ